MKEQHHHNNTPSPTHAGSHYDVGIYGLWYGSNYGSIITYYALSRVIGSMGLSCAMISNPLGSEPDIDTLVRSHSLRFAEDHYAVSPKYSLPEMHCLNGMFDRFVLGSDQMWNIGLSRPYRQSYFLDFADEDHAKIAYATSFGRDVWRGTEEERLATQRNLRRFTGISVRDAFSHDILRTQFGIDSTPVMDPVFLCPMTDYQALIDETGERVTSPESAGACTANSGGGECAGSAAAGQIDLSSVTPYIFAYILDPDASIGSGLSQIAEETGLTVYVVFDEGRYVRGEFDRVRNVLALTSPRVICLNDITVQEWLLLYSRAKLVLTDSFHGTCFSILFQKPFIVKKNTKRGGSRFDHLLGTFALTDRMIERSDGFYEKFLSDKGGGCAPDYEAVYRILDAERTRCRKWLQEALTLPREDLPPVTLAAKAVTSRLEPDSCVGCGACVSVCPKDALLLLPDRYGYYVSSINYDACINCGQCASVCPALSLPERRNAEMPDCRAFIAKDNELLYASSSGAVFPLLADRVLQQGGAVAGAAWNVVSGDNPGGAEQRDSSSEAGQHTAQGKASAAEHIDFTGIPVKHVIVDTPEGAALLRKSKYLQSYMGDTDRKVRQLLESGRKVLFTGCPCQVAGLKKFLGKEYDNLLMADLLCGNAPSAGFFKKYLEESFPQGVIAYQFRSKSHGWNANCVRITLSDGSVVERRGGKEDLYQKAYHSHLMCPPHCEQCPYQSLPRYGDLTIGDFWGYSKKDASVDTTKGISVVLINSDKGRKFLSSIPESDILLGKSVPAAWLGGNGSALPGRHNWASPVRDTFYRQITEHSFAEAVRIATSPKSEAAGKEETAQKARIRQLEQELLKEQQRREAAEEALSRIEGSRSYRFGRAVSSPLRKLRKLRHRQEKQ